MRARQLVIDDRIAIPDEALDHDGYRRWVTSEDYPAGIRPAYVTGDILIEISPEAIEAHNKVKTAITRTVSAVVEARDLGEVYSDGVLVTHESARLSTEPDLTFVSWESFERGRVRLEPRAGRGDEYLEIVGSPDLVVEIVSDSSVKKDTVVLHDAYGLAGVREYWLIDARGADLRFTIFTSAGDRFATASDVAGPQESHVLGGRWSLSRTRNRLGRFSYRLDSTE